MNGYLAVVLAVTIPSAVDGCVRVYTLRTDPRRVTARAAAKAAAKGQQQ